ncbi:MlaD family protein [Nocardia inohanensis]|uniref:MlaD family protein n=1 Tax=Nocardia inohanensis TaxID=209246 RepID=UPI000834C270|nr:MlaD family protein [Nocardia inohanensis]
MTDEATTFRPRRIQPASVASLGAIAAVLLIGAGYLTFGLLRFDPLGEHTDARLLLLDSGTVGPRTPVLLTGIEVGEVTAVHKVTDGVEVQFRLDGEYRVPAASAVRIENLSALGEPYIEFRPTSEAGPYVADGQLLDLRKTRAPTRIPELATKVVAVVNQFDPKTITGLVNTFDQALAGTESEVPRLERANKLLAATILSRTDVLRRLLTDLQTAGADMDWAGPGLAESGPYWGLLGERLDQLISTASGIFEVGNAPADYLNGDGIVPFLKRLDAFLAEHGPELAPLVPALRPLTDRAVSAVAPLDISALISTALAAVSADGAVRLQPGAK